MKKILSSIILGGTLFFLAKALKDNWLEVTAIRIDGVGWATLALATGVTLLAHTWAGWIWTWVLQELNQPVPTSRFIQVYLKTNIAKYLPGNIWHYYGRIIAAKNANVSAGAATLSVLLEPLLMAAAALIIIVLLANQFADANNTLTQKIVQLLSLVAVLCAVHPQVLNPTIHFLHRLSVKKSATITQSTVALRIEHYPLRPLLGELGFLVLRGTGFILTLFALSSWNYSQVLLLLGTFSFAWLLGLVIPGAPGGVGVLEATAFELLRHHFPEALVFSTLALYRLVSILAETAGAALASLSDRLEKS